MQLGDVFMLFTLLFVLDPVMQILKSLTLTDGNEMSLHYLKSKSRSPLNLPQRKKRNTQH
jgi:hypothetical protein